MFEEMKGCEYECELKQKERWRGKKNKKARAI
jgi:hypothetical protein